MVQDIDQPVNAEHFGLCIGRFGHTVRIQEEGIARFEPERVFLVVNAVHRTDCDAVLVLIQLVDTAVPLDDRILMTGIGGRQSACGNFKNAEPDGHEHLDLIVGAECFVGLGENIGSRSAEHCTALQNGLGNHHKQRCRNALSGDVGNDETEMIFVDQEEIIEVSADLSGRLHNRIDIKLMPVRVRRECMRQHGRLNFGCQCQFRADAFFFGGDLQQVGAVFFQGVLHICHGVRELFQFVTGADAQCGEVIAVRIFCLLTGCEALGCLGNPVDRVDEFVLDAACLKP